MSDDPGTPQRAPAEEPRPDANRLQERLSRWERRDTATVVGIGMILAGILLAVIGRPESALIWTGAIVAALGLLVDRIASFEAGTSGAKVTTRDIQVVADRAAQEAPTVQAPTVVATSPSNEPMMNLAGPYWRQDAVNAALTAVGSNSRYQARVAFDQLNDLMAGGTAIVNIDTGDRIRASGEVDSGENESPDDVSQ